MFWVESCLRVCTRDPAHGKPYASEQWELSFWGGGGLIPFFTNGASETWTVSLLRYYRVVMLLLLLVCQEVRCCFTWQWRKGQRLAGASPSDTGDTGRKSGCLLSHAYDISLTSCWLPYPPSPPSLSVLPQFIPPSIPRGGRKVGRLSTLPGATGSLCHPLTQTAGSALHTRIIRR